MEHSITVLGLGYVGLPLALVAASNNAKVNGYDVNESKIDLLNSGETFLDEKDLIKLWENHHKGMNFSTDIQKSDTYIIAVPTPLYDKQITCDLSYVEEACKTISGILKENDLIILVSTCPAGTTDFLAGILEKNTSLVAGKDFHLSYCPERLYPGDTFNEIINNDHLIGGFTNTCSIRVSDFYRRYFTKKIVSTTAKLAELVKLAENSYRDVNIAFANELAKISLDHDQDVWSVISLANLHPRVNILEPGIGVGGHCLPIDPWFLMPSQQRNSSSVIRASRHLNGEMPSLIAYKIILELMKNREEKKVVALPENVLPGARSVS